MLAVALASVALALALPFKIWVSQRSEIHQLEAQTRQQQQRVDALQAEERRWQDPAYVRAQARQRLHYVMPGETAYVVTGVPQRPATSPANPAGTTPDAASPWYSRLWHTVEVAGAERR